MIDATPMLMMEPLVCATLAGEKTVTRRPITERWARHLGFIGGSGNDRDDPEEWGFWADDQHRWAVLAQNVPDTGPNGLCSLPCRYGVAGGLLRVRENHWLGGERGARACNVKFAADGTSIRVPLEQPLERSYAIERKRPSIHLPNWAARLYPRIVSLRAERLQAITHEDAAREGMAWIAPSIEPRDAFRMTWISMHGEDAWNANDFVWRIEYSVPSLRPESALQQGAAP